MAIDYAANTAVATGQQLSATAIDVEQNSLRRREAGDSDDLTAVEYGAKTRATTARQQSA